MVEKLSSKALAILAFCISLYTILIDMKDFNFLIFIHIIIIGISSASLFSYINKPYSLFKMFHVFTLFFIGIAPILQFYIGVKFSGAPEIPYKYKVITSLTFLISTIIYNAIYYTVVSKFSIKFLEHLNLKFDSTRFRAVKFPLSINLLMIALSGLCFFMIFRMKNYNILSLFFRGGVFSETLEIGKSSSLIIEKFFRPLSLLLFVFSYYYNRKSWVTNVFLFLLLLITAFPLGLGRNAAAGLYLPLVLLFIPTFSRKNIFVGSMIFGLLVVFPFLNKFRTFNDKTEINIGLDFDMFTEMHFDAYITLARVIYHDIITYGNQLLGVFFFFIPRAVWPSKPLSSGQFHANELGMTFDNLACTYLAEGYINFGFFGVFIFIIIMAYSTAVIDKCYWKLKENDSFFNVIYVLLLGMFLFVIRGDLMNGYAFTFGFIFTAVFTYKMFNFIFKFVIKSNN